MKLILKKTVIFFLLISMLLCSSCVSEINANNEYTVTYVYGDGRENSTKTIKSGWLIEREKPEREGFEFVGWCTDNALTNFYDFTKPIETDTVLYAKWNVDYKTLIEKANAEAVSAALKVVVPSAFGTSSQGSGVVYKQEGNYCYALTNNHVVAKSNGVASNVYAYDSLGTQYNAIVVKADVKYDLAVIKINVGSNSKFKVMNIADRIPNENEMVVMVSTPNGQYNTVSLGNVVLYHEVDDETSSMEHSDVDFKVLWISGEADHGSSGGAVYDTEFNVLGIIYASIKATETEEEHILVIPSENVLEFISKIKY